MTPLRDVAASGLVLIVLFALFDALGAPPPARGWAIASDTAPTLRIVDADGALFGRYGGSSQGGGVGVLAFIPSPRGTAMLAMAGDAGTGTLAFEAGTLYFKSSDCSGTPYIDGTNLAGALPAMVFTAYPDELPTLYVADSLVPDASLASAKIVNPFGCFSSQYSGLRLHSVTSAPIPLSPMFTPPFRVL